jgi:hypothetical protein
MAIVRVYYRGARVIAVEHRVDEGYTDDNRLPPHQADDWFTTDANNRRDPEGEKIGVQWSTVDDTQPDGILRINTDPDWPTEKQRRRDRHRGAGGRRDELLAKLQADTITRPEERELMRLERGL